VSEERHRVLSEVYKGLKELIEARAEVLRSARGAAEGSRDVKALLMKRYSRGGLLVKFGGGVPSVPQAHGSFRRRRRGVDSPRTWSRQRELAPRRPGRSGARTEVHAIIRLSKGPARQPTR